MQVAHVQFRSRIAFKLVWAPPTFEAFVLVDDAGDRAWHMRHSGHCGRTADLLFAIALIFLGDLLNSGTPAGELPSLRQRQQNYALVRGSKYAAAAEKLGGARK